MRVSRLCGGTNARPPVRAGALARRARRGPRYDRQGRDGEGKRVKILLVEDDAALAAEVAKVLRAENFVLDQAGTGEDAQHLGETEGYDAVVLDLGLPKGDGVSVLRAWRAGGGAPPGLALPPP